MTLKTDTRKRDCVHSKQLEYYAITKLSLFQKKAYNTQFAFCKRKQCQANKAGTGKENLACIPSGYADRFLASKTFQCQKLKEWITALYLICLREDRHYSLSNLFFSLLTQRNMYNKNQIDGYLAVYLVFLNTAFLHTSLLLVAKMKSNFYLYFVLANYEYSRQVFYQTLEFHRIYL